MDFRTRLIETLRAVQTLLDVPGVMVVGSEVPNLLQPDAASTLVVSQQKVAVLLRRLEAVMKEER